MNPSKGMSPLYLCLYKHQPGFPGASVAKESTCNVGDVGDASSIPGLEDSLEEGMVTCSNILA